MWVHAWLFEISRRYAVPVLRPGLRDADGWLVAVMRLRF